MTLVMSNDTIYQSLRTVRCNDFTDQRDNFGRKVNIYFGPQKDRNIIQVICFISHKEKNRMVNMIEGNETESNGFCRVGTKTFWSISTTCRDFTAVKHGINLFNRGEKYLYEVDERMYKDRNRKLQLDNFYVPVNTIPFGKKLLSIVAHWSDRFNEPRFRKKKKKSGFT